MGGRMGAEIGGQIADPQRPIGIGRPRLGRRRRRQRIGEVAGERPELPEQDVVGRLRVRRQRRDDHGVGHRIVRRQGAGVLEGGQRVVVAAEGQQAGTQMRPRLGVSGIQLQRLVEDGRCTVVVAPLVERQAEIAERLDGLRIDREGRAEGLFGSGQTIQRQEGVTQIDPRPHEIGLDRQGVLEGGHGLVVAAELLQHQAGAVMGACVFGVTRQRLVIGLKRFFDPAVVTQRIAEIVVDGRGVREGQGSAKGVRRGVGTTNRLQRQPTVAVNRRIVRRQRSGAFQAAQRGSRLALDIGGHAGQVQGLDMIGRGPQHLEAQGFGIAGAPRSEPADRGPDLDIERCRLGVHRFPLVAPDVGERGAA